MVSAFSRWKRYDETRQNLAKVSSWCHFFYGWNNHPKALMLICIQIGTVFNAGTAGDDRVCQWTVRERI